MVEILLKFSFSGESNESASEILILIAVNQRALHENAKLHTNDRVFAAHILKGNR